ncbi:MAG TPA: response regulator [Flavobacterium sp.]|jgi:two-component system KDP operon response regulator KdpE
MSNRPTILINDESQIRKLLEITLDSSGYKTLFAATAAEGMLMAANHLPDLILLDLGLPDMDGQEVLHSLRQWHQNPVIILSVKSTEAEIVKALDNGANDFLTKPFRTQELLARIRTVLRNQNVAPSAPLITFDAVVIDLVARIVKVDDIPIKLTATEYSLLTLLVKNEGRVLTHQYLLKEIWGTSYVEQTQYLRVFIAQLRKKLEKDPNRPKYLLTESGIGYRFSTS